MSNPTKTGGGTTTLSTQDNDRSKVMKLNVEQIMKTKSVSKEEAERLLKDAQAHYQAELKLHRKYGKGSGFKDRYGNDAEADIVKGSLRDGSKVAIFKDDGVTPKFDKKRVVTIRCKDTGKARVVATSDLQNVCRTVEAQEEYLKQFRAKRKSKKAGLDFEAAETLEELLK